jgi:hypothetical protein
MRRTLATFLITVFSAYLTGCSALDTYHYIGIYEVNRKQRGTVEQEWATKYEEFCQAFKQATGYDLRETMHDSNMRMDFVIVPQSAPTCLNRVVITWYSRGELSISIIKVPAGENPETEELKRHIESAFRAAGIRDWTFYLQRSHGQIFNN